MAVGCGRCRSGVLALAVVGAWLMGRSAAASEAEAADAAAPAEVGGGDAAGEGGPRDHLLVPPVPIDLPAIGYPADGAPLAEPLTVDVVLTIDSEGAVTEVAVTHSAGAAIDRAVVAGAKRFRFHPASQDGVPLVVRVPFSQTFTPPPPPAPSLVAAQPERDAVIEGLVITRGARTPVAAATVVAIDQETGQHYVAVTDAEGLFRLPVTSTHPLELRIAAAEHEKFLQKEELAKNQRLKVKYLIDRKSYGQYESYVRAETDRTEVSRTTLSGPEITRVPGTFGDPFRVINVLPGVSSAMGLLPLPIVRGSSPGNTGVLLDAVRLPLLFHLFAGPSVIHPEFIDRVDFYPGGFPVSYGGYTGGIVDGVTRAARPDERRIDIDLNLTQTGVLVREPVAPLGATATVAGRIGYPGLILSLLSPDVSLSYWDYQARIDGGKGSHHWTVFAYGAQDVLKNRSAPGEPLATVASFTFHRLDLRYLHGDTIASELYRVVLGYDDSFFGGNNGSDVAGDSGLGNGTWSINPMLRLRRSPASWLQLNFGAESLAHSIRNPPPSTNTPNTPVAADVARLFNSNGFYSASGFFAEAMLHLSERLRLIPGFRVDLYDEQQKSGNVSQLGFDPRLLARYRLTDVLHGSVWLKGVVGRYHQPPRLFVPVPGLDASSLELGLLGSTQYSVGAEARLGAHAELDVNTYYNAMDPVLFDLTVNPSAADVQQPQPSTLPWKVPTATTGEKSGTLSTLFQKREGRSYGLEVLLRRRAADQVFGWISYTLSRSERRTAEGWQLFDFDRLHILNLVTGMRLPRNWEFGIRILYQTGTPLTTIFGSNIARSDSQFRLDLRLDKRAVWNRWLLDFYVDIINTTVSAESGGLVGGSAIRYVVPTLGVRGIL